MQKSKSIKILTQTALLIAIVLVLRNFSYMLYFGGGAGLRISPSVFFSKLPALIFGPLYGGIADGIVDVLAYVIKPDGAYIPLLTLTSIAGGVFVGLLWKGIKNINTELFRKIFFIVFSVIALFGAMNLLFSSFSIGGAYLGWLTSFKKLTFLTVWPLCAGLLALLLFVLDYFLRKKSGFPQNFIKLFTVLFIVNIFITTINTFVLMIFIPSLGKMGFIAFYIPRFIEECVMTTLQSIGSAYLLKIYDRIYKIGSDNL